MIEEKTTAESHLLFEYLLKNEECDWIEFKVNNSNPNEIGEYISALANSALLVNQDFAYYIFGVEDKTKNIVGTKCDFHKQKVGNEDIIPWLNRKLKPQVNFSILDLYIEEKKIIIIEISKARIYPIEFDNVAYIRLDSYKKKLSDLKEKEKELWDKLNQVNFEEEIAIKNIDPAEMRSFLNVDKYYELLKLPIPTDGNKIITDFIEEGLLCIYKGLLCITNLGAILFSKDISKVKSLNRKTVRLIEYKGINKFETIRDMEFKFGYAINFEEILKYIKVLLPQNEYIGTALRNEIVMYPELAIREILANALIHQDFDISGTGILIELYSDRMEITNPGNPLISIDRLIDHSPISRNEKLASLMRRFKICEEKGSGIDKVILSIELFQLPAPSFTKDKFSTKVILYSYKKLTEMSRDDKIRACYQHACLQYVSNKKMTNETLRKRFNIDSKNSAIASRLLNDAVESKFIKEYSPESGSRRYKNYIPYWG